MGRQKTSNQKSKIDNKIILEFIIKNNKVTAGQIRKYLEQIGHNFNSTRGFYKRLASLVKRGIIIKSWDAQHNYPVYSLSKDDEGFPFLLGFLLKARILEELEDIRATEGEENFWRFFTVLSGVYTMYLETLVWGLVAHKKTLNGKLYARAKFLEGALPLTLPIPDKLDKTTNPILNIGRAEKYYEELPKKLIKFEKELGEKLPLYLTFCKLAYAKTKKSVDRMAEL